MCERCREDTVWGELIEVDEEVDCEWVEDEEITKPLPVEEEEDPWFGGCPEPATCRVFTRYAEEHLCTAHMEEDCEELEEGLGDFLRESGLLVASDYLPIHEPTQCERCDRSASHAKMVVDEHYVCLKHAKEMGWDPDSPTAPE
ncbi:MAG: hypothetical protein ACYTDY_09600 [Planctomycetota bacterium]|jgi:hypothetical protein